MSKKTDPDKRVKKLKEENIKLSNLLQIQKESRELNPSKQYFLIIPREQLENYYKAAGYLPKNVTIVSNDARLEDVIEYLTKRQGEKMSKNQTEKGKLPEGNGHPCYDDLIIELEKWEHLNVENYDNQSKLMSVGFNSCLKEVIEYLTKKGYTIAKMDIKTENIEKAKEILSVKGTLPNEQK